MNIFLVLCSAFLPGVFSAALDCSDYGTEIYPARDSAYYPEGEGGDVDMDDHPLHTLQVVDMGPDTRGKGHSRIDICVRDEEASRDSTINSALTLVFPSVPQGLDCSGFGNHTYHATGTGYYPDDSPIEGGYVDMRGRPLRTLQDFLERNVEYVSVAMDDRLGITYGTKICIKELNIKYNKLIVFEVVDTGPSFRGKGYTRIDICVKDENASFDNTINGPLTLVFP